MVLIFAQCNLLYITPFSFSFPQLGLVVPTDPHPSTPAFSSSGCTTSDHNNLALTPERLFIQQGMPNMPLQLWQFDDEHLNSQFKDFLNIRYKLWYTLKAVALGPTHNDSTYFLTRATPL